MANYTRYGYYVAVVYQDSAPENWRELLNDLHINWIESPLHHLDHPRPHWHIIGSLINVSPDNFDEVLSSINGSRCERIYNQKAFIFNCLYSGYPHQRNYSINEIVFHGDFDIGSIFHLLPIKEIRTYG